MKLKEAEALLGMIEEGGAARLQGGYDLHKVDAATIEITHPTGRVVRKTPKLAAQWLKEVKVDVGMAAEFLNADQYAIALLEGEGLSTSDAQAVVDAVEVTEEVEEVEVPEKKETQKERIQRMIVEGASALASNGVDPNKATPDQAMNSLLPDYDPNMSESRKFSAAWNKAKGTMESPQVDGSEPEPEQTEKIKLNKPEKKDEEQKDEKPKETKPRKYKIPADIPVSTAHMHDDGTCSVETARKLIDRLCERAELDNNEDAIQPLSRRKGPWVQLASYNETAALIEVATELGNEVKDSQDSDDKRLVKQLGRFVWRMEQFLGEYQRRLDEPEEEEHEHVEGVEVENNEEVEEVEVVTA